MRVYVLWFTVLPTCPRRTAYGDSLSEDERKEEPAVHKRRSSLSELGNKLTSLILPLKTLVPAIASS